jgi:hypothetical protein
MSKTLPPIRRVVTGHNDKNVARVIMDGPAINHKGGASGATSTLIWSTDTNPADCSIGENIEDLGARVIGTPPPENGSRFAVITFPPGNPGRMHRTETIDYVIVISGRFHCPAQGRRRHGPARHQPCLGQPVEQAGTGRVRSARFETPWHRPSDRAR